MELTPDLVENLIEEMRLREEFNRFTTIKKSKNFIICSTGPPKNLEPVGFLPK